jgi:hypothetical protein
MVSEGKTYTVRRSIFASVFPGIGPNSRREEVIDPENGQPMLEMTGFHVERCASAAMKLLPERGTLRFPVSGTRLKNAVMSAVDDSETTVLRFRLSSHRLRGRSWMSAMEVNVDPNVEITSEIAIVVAVASTNLKSYFQQRGGGA